MSNMLKFHVGLIIAICTVEIIDASCLSYGHSCWGAHGKRSFAPQRELSPGEPSDRWAIFKFMPERNEALQFKKLLRANSNIPSVPESEMKSMNFPSMEQQVPFPEESNLNDEKDLSRNFEELAQESENYMQRQQQAQRMPLMKPFQVVRINKQNIEQ